MLTQVPFKHMAKGQSQRNSWSSRACPCGWSCEVTSYSLVNSKPQRDVPIKPFIEELYFEIYLKLYY